MRRLNQAYHFFIGCTLCAAVLIGASVASSQNWKFGNISTTSVLNPDNGGVGNAFVLISGPASTTKTYTVPNADSVLAVIVATGTSTLATGSINSGACASAVTTAATGAATTDNLSADFTADPTATTGYTAAAMLTIVKYITAGNVNFKVCNTTAGALTPGAALVLRWRVIRGG